MDLSIMLFSQELERLKKLRDRYQRSLDELSKYKGARLTTASCRNGAPQVYVKMPGQKSYRYAGDPELITNIRRYRICERAVKDLSNNISSIEKGRQALVPCDLESVLGRVAAVYSAGMEDVVNRDLGVFSEKGRSWVKKAEEKYGSQEPYKPEGLIHSCGGGLKVRSKSEAIIVAALRRKGIPFFYELEVTIGNITFHPDFVLYSEKLGCVIIWEHFGKLADAAYKHDAKGKVSHYMTHGWLPCENLILSYDDEKGGIDISRINAKIDEYF